MAFYEMRENNCKFANNVSDKGLYPNYVKNPFNSIAKQIAQLKICRGNEETFFFFPREDIQEMLLVTHPEGNAN